MAKKWLRELERGYPSLAKTARRLNAEDGFAMGAERSRRRSSGDRDGDDSRGKGKRKHRHSQRNGGSDYSSEKGRESGSGSSSHKRGRADGSDGSREESLTPPVLSGSPV